MVRSSCRSSGRTPWRRQPVLQYRTDGQLLSHFLRQVNRRPQEEQYLESNC